jgi:hypothetical protein
VRMLVGLVPEAEAALWRYLFDMDLAGTIKLSGRPLDDPVRWRLADPRRLRVTDVGDHLWVRLLDVPGALAARRYAVADALVLEVTDALRPGNQGRFRLEGGPDGATCEPTWPWTWPTSAPPTSAGPAWSRWPGPSGWASTPRGRCSGPTGCSRVHRRLSAPRTSRGQL